MSSLRRWWGLFIACGCAYAASAVEVPRDPIDPAAGIVLPQGTGKGQLERTCSRCHPLAVVVARRRSPEEWGDVVSRMAALDVYISDDEQLAIVAYLSSHFGVTPAHE